MVVQMGSRPNGCRPDNSPPGHFQTAQVLIGPDEWFDWFVVVLVESCPKDSSPDGQ